MKALYALSAAILVSALSFAPGNAFAEEYDSVDTLGQICANTHDKKCLGPNNSTAAAGCKKLCEDTYGGTYDAGWGHIGGCRNMSSAPNPNDFNFNKKKKSLKRSR